MNKAIPLIPSLEFYALLLLFSLLFLLLLFYQRNKSLKLQLQKLMSQKKSSEVRSGKISETLSPLTELFPVDIKKPGTSTVFIGQPIDYIHFDPDEGVTFIEIKSGKSNLSNEQKKIKNAILQGNVSWEEVWIKD